MLLGTLNGATPVSLLLQKVRKGRKSRGIWGGEGTIQGWYVGREDSLGGGGEVRKEVGKSGVK